MLNSINLYKFKFLHGLMLLALMSLYSCMPTSTPPAVKESSIKNPGTETTPTYQEPNFPLTGIFLQEGAVQSLSNLALPVNFTDSFLIRGKALSVYLRTIPNSTKFCLAGRYNYEGGKDKFLVLSAKAKSFTDLNNKTTEFYLQVEPSNDTANQNDCMTYNLSNALYSIPSKESNTVELHYSFNQLCSNCTTAVSSTGLKIYFINGEEVPTISTSTLQLTISGSINNGGAGGCSESSVCKARGYDCCLQSQCVKDGAIKPGASSLPGFMSAQEDVRLNPNRFVVYPQYYFVCETRPENGGPTPGEETTDPNYEASIRILEMKQLYECLNKVDGEFSYCTLKFNEASKNIPGVFSAADSGYFDDINFSSINPALGQGDYSNNIVRIVYGGQTLYEQNKTPLTAGSFVDDTANDNLDDAQAVQITATLPGNALDANLYLTYKVDGSCEKLNASMAKCTKTYIHGYSDNTSTMWQDGSKVYLLPDYADVSPNSNIIVKISGVVVPEDSTTWSKREAPTKRIVFSGSYHVYQNQNVEITYYVTENANKLIKFRSDVQSRVNTMCSCSSTIKCNLTPVMDSTNTSVINYACSYPTPTSEAPPVNQTVYVSNKNIAHRYFDENGVSYDEDYTNALPQELNEFKYTNNDVLKPNNVSEYIGFNEIYGSFAKTGTYLARPAKMVRVKKDQQYDILVSSGVFSSCLSCGSDYYSAIKKIFPQNFGGQAGGYAPDNYDSTRINSTGLYRADDLLFGRACFVPATMIPWTHVTAATPREQRRARLAGQHFLFANGYNRDWYGFDYGSLIGSFDGVTWFSIGNQRRVTAKTNKLYLAVNTYLGDLSVDSNFNVSISETSAYSGDVPDHDTETDGAQCQQSHYCKNDNDCFRQLGYDYLCQNVSPLTTNWPQFDGNASEISGSTQRSLSSILGGVNGQALRCVYRGRGAPCLPNLNEASTKEQFNGSPLIGSLTCAPNYTCQPLTTPNRFNDRIARFANTPGAQNLADPTNKSDTVGLGARIILRPYDYYGKESTPPVAGASLSFNKVEAICVPGKNVTAATGTFDLNSRLPSNRTETSDKILGVGPSTSLLMSPRTLNACPATDAAGNSMQLFDLTIGDPVLNQFTFSQNLSTNLLNLSPLVNLNIYNVSGENPVTTVGYQRNACLRAPGASCFSDMECAPSPLIASKAKSANLASVLNAPEAKYWEEELVCGNPDFKQINGINNPEYDIKKNKCCREIGKILTVYTQTNNSNFKWCENNTIKVAGVNTSFSDYTRYSRVHTAYDKMTCNVNEIDSTRSFALSIAAPNTYDRFRQILGQYRTLDTINQRTCCTKNWVRSFASENGGGHAFAKTKLQTVDKAMFKHISWGPENNSIPGVVDDPFECHPDQFTNSSCEIKNLTPDEENLYLTWAGSLELIGIPQVAVKTNDEIFKLVNDSQLAVTPRTQPLTDSNNKQVFLPVDNVGEDFNNNGTRYYSAASYNKFNIPNNTLKKVFSEDEFNCCIPSGQEVPATTPNSQCCTGFKASDNNVHRCCLPDFTDVTVYLNRYVSSEGSGLPESSYDEETGYIKDPGQVKIMAVQKNLCCSGQAMTGVAISNLSIPLTNGTFKPASPISMTRRFNYRTDEVDNNGGNVSSIFDAGVRWNNHVYCVPESLVKAAGGN